MREQDPSKKATLSDESNYSLSFIPKFEFIETEERALEVLDILKERKIVSIDTETTGLDPYSCRLLLLQIAIPDMCFILNCGKVRPDIWNDVISSPSILKIVQNGAFDYKILKVHSNVSMRPMFDTMVAERLITCGKQFKTSLKFLASKYLGMELDKEIRRDFIGVYRNKFSQAELAYAAIDALILYEIYDRQIDALQRDELVTVALLEFNTLVPTAEMELNGCLIDKKKWRSLIRIAEKSKQEAEEKIKKLLLPVCSQLSIFGECILNISSQKQLLAHLHRMGIQVEDTSDASLEEIDHEIGSLLRKWRGFDKVCSAYGSSLLSKIHPKTGRLHARFNQLRADTGRYTSSDPNLQQIPGFNEDDPDSLNFRSCFIASPGKKIVTADFAQQELRIIACLSKDEKLIEAFKNDADIHTQTAINIWGGTEEEVRRNGKRNIAKTVNFLVNYGGAAFTLAKRLGITEQAAERLISDYFNVYSSLRSYINSAGFFAIQNGYSMTVSGRRRYFDIPTVDDLEYKQKISSIKRKGVNTPVQGSGADVTKQALCNFFYGAEEKNLDVKLLMIVHDEIVCEVPDEQAEEVSKLLEESMIGGFTAFFKDVPMKADACVDTYWHH